MMREESRQITDQIVTFIEQHATDTRDFAAYESDYNKLALQLFQFQFTYNAAYKKYCQLKRKSPLTVKDWRQIPPMPIQGFKELSLTCEPPEEAEAVFMTSGTTNPDKQGRNYHPALRVWDASMIHPFKQFVLPDREKITMLVISPAEDLNQNSSLSRYLTQAVIHLGSEQSRFFFNEQGLNMQALAQALRAAEADGEPVLILGATFAYVHFLDFCKEQNLTFSLPAGSRIFDTGGFKGKSREVDMEQLYAQFTERFQVARNFCINMYGMTELSSQIYDQTIRTTVLSQQTITDKKGPAWTQTRVLDPDTLEEVNDGETGVLAHYDLANWNSCLAILTEDLGYKTKDGFVLLGRVKGSEARGCSIAVDQLLQANRK